MIDPSLNAEDVDNWITPIAAAVEGLRWMSEADAPFDVYCWTDIAAGGLTSEAVLTHAQLLSETPIEAISLDDFLAPVIVSQPWHSEEEAQSVLQFQALKALLEQTLTQIQVYRCGTVEIEIYVVGRLQGSNWLVLHTTAVET